MATNTYDVTGMTCGHCAQAVTTEISAITGVESVDVDVESGRVVVVGTDVTDDAVRAAVEEAGYAVV